jgi:hypothetical protein
MYDLYDLFVFSDGYICMDQHTHTHTHTHAQSSCHRQAMARETEGPRVSEEHEKREWQRKVKKAYEEGVRDGEMMHNALETYARSLKVSRRSCV